MLGVVLSLLAALSLGSGAVSGRAGMAEVHPIAVIGVALVVGFVGLSGLSSTASIVSQPFAVQRADVVIVAPLLAPFPLWTLLLAHIFIARMEEITLRRQSVRL
jgi:uncharacterized membrane protein